MQGVGLDWLRYLRLILMIAREKKSMDQDRRKNIVPNNTRTIKLP
jgi:hypothetical protein